VVLAEYKEWLLINTVVNIGGFFKKIPSLCTGDMNRFVAVSRPAFLYLFALTFCSA
jgi:hypothetical protein